MELHRNILSSKYSKHLLVEEANRFTKRVPLSHLTGNAQHHTVASASPFYQDKGHHHPVDRPLYPNPPSLSSSPRQCTPNQLQIRRQHTREQRSSKYPRNPLLDVEKYRAYRERQAIRHTKIKDPVWPELLEDAFLDALLIVPKMGRGQFIYNGKKCGRNEMIDLWLWIAYLQSLGPGERPDPKMKRPRKRISSKLGTVKGYFEDKDSPVYELLFGKEDAVQEDWNKNPILIALSQGRLPTIDEGSKSPGHNPNHMSPATFWLLVALKEKDNTRLQSPTEGDLHDRKAVSHRYTGLDGQRRQENLESMPNWRRRFPAVARLQNASELNCSIVHMDVSLGLADGFTKSNLELITNFEMTLPGRDMEHGQWRTIITLSKPPSVSAPEFERPLDAEIFPASVLFSNDLETRVKVAFPAQTWMHTFCCLARIQNGYYMNLENGVNALGINSETPTMSTTEVIDQISMYQEVQCSIGPGLPFCRRAIILWTFREAESGEEGFTTWRFLETTAPMETCTPSTSKVDYPLVAGMEGNFQALDGHQGGMNGGVSTPSMYGQGSMSTLSPYMMNNTHPIVSSPQSELHSHAGSVMNSPFIRHDFHTYPSPYPTPYISPPPNDPGICIAFASSSRSLPHNPLNTQDPALQFNDHYLPSNGMVMNFGPDIHTLQGADQQAWYEAERRTYAAEPTWQDFSLHESAWDISAEGADVLCHSTTADMTSHWASAGAAANEQGEWLLGQGLHIAGPRMALDWGRIDHAGEQGLAGEHLGNMNCENDDDLEEDDHEGGSGS